MFAYLTLFIYLAVGVVFVRVYAPEKTTVEFTTSYLNIFSKSHLRTVAIAAPIAPEIGFAELKFPKEETRPLRVAMRASDPVKESAHIAKDEIKVLTKTNLPFQEIIVLKPVTSLSKFETNLIALFKEQNFEAIAKIENTDSVSTLMAAAKDAEPDYFEYKAHENNPKNSFEQASTTPPKAKTLNEPTGDAEIDEVLVDNLVNIDYPVETHKEPSRETATSPGLTVTTQNLVAISSPMTSQVDFRQPPLMKNQKMKPDSGGTITKKAGSSSEQNTLGNSLGFIQENARSFQSQVTIHITGTNLKEMTTEVGFEVRPLDDLTEAVSDYNSGEVILDQIMADDKMTRSVALLKHGFAPTNVDLILEEGASDISIPLIEENTFNEMLAPYESRGAIGAVLVELEDGVESASIDVPYSQVLKLNKNLQATETDVFSYQLFLGVRAGNAMLSYKSTNGEVTSKILHIHEHELTFETNFFEDVQSEQVSLVEEDLLSKEKTRLIISTNSIKQFATDKLAKKINDNTFRTDFNRTLLGGRKYVELIHQQEPIFVGYRNSSVLEIPSENFMRYVLSKFESGKLGSRCLIQINLTQKAVRVDMGSESIGESLMTSMQALDADGKFYDSVGEKTRRLIVVGENQGAMELGQDSKINFKITYRDGSVQYLGSYCSPNTYLVEQL
jgi:hypothetical protein